MSREPFSFADQAVCGSLFGGLFVMVIRRLFITVGAIALLAAAGCLIWRWATLGRTALPTGQTTPMVSIGRSHGVVIAPDGSLWSWGGEDHGWPVLGMGQTNFRRAFNPNLRQIGYATNWVGVAAGQEHNLALRSDGTIWAWGSDLHGQLGGGRSARANPSNRPVQTARGHDWARVMAGFVCSYALQKDGTLWAWGLNNFSQLGIGTTNDVARPVQVGTATNWVKIAAGGVSAGGIQSDGSLWIWGGSPKLGNTAPFSPENIQVPTRFTSETNWADLSVAFNLWMGIKLDGTLWAWGRNAHVFTGAPTNACDTPMRIGTNTDWKACSSSSGGFSHLLQKKDGSFWVLTAPALTHDSLTLQPIHLPDDIVAFNFGGYSGGYGGGTGAVITREGEVWTWGVVLGKRTARDRFLQFLGECCWRMGWQVNWVPRSSSTVRDKPWRLRNRGSDNPATE